MKNPINLFLDTLMQIDREDEYQTTAETLEVLEDALERYDGNVIDLVLIADRIKTIGATVFDQYKEDAWYATQVEGNFGKHTHKGNSITPVESHFKYEYPDDEYINKVTQQLTPVLKKKKSLEDSIKARQKELVENDEATLVGSSKTLRIDKK